jgi:hypothetical protein
MDKIAGLPFYPVQITKQGKIFSQEEKEAIENAVSQSDADKLTDLVVMSHGWNNDMADARQLYNKLFTNLAAIIPEHPEAGNRKLAIVGVFWPSKKFADEDLIPAGDAASIGDEGPEPTSAALKEKLEKLKGTFDGPDESALEEAKGLVDRLEENPTNQKKFVDLIRSVLPAHPSDSTDDASDLFMKMPGDRIFQSLAPPSMFAVVPPAGDFGDAQGGALMIDDQSGAAAGFFDDLFSGIKAAAWRLLNFATYYQMKERAGLVGKGLNEMLDSVRKRGPKLRVHLIGHSFGARVVTSAVDGPSQFQPSSLTLLQGAFSHNGFAEKFDQTKDGFFRKVVAQSKVNGPIIVTHTINDRAVGIAYPIASRLANDDATAVGDENDVFGGIGRNGAVKMKEKEFIKALLLPDAGKYQFLPKKVHNLRADRFITGHSDVTGRQVANAIIHAVLS